MPKKLYGLLVALGVLVVFAVGALSALGVRSLVVPTASAEPQVPNPGHSWSEIGDLPGMMWHSNNDGPGSSLDADTVDGKHASELGGGLSSWFKSAANVNVTVQGGTWLFVGTAQTDGAHCHNLTLQLVVDGGAHTIGRKGGCYDNGDPVQGITLYTIPAGTHSVRFSLTGGGLEWTSFIGIKLD